MRSKITLYVVCCMLYAVTGAQWLERAVQLSETLGLLEGPRSIVVNPVSGHAFVEAAGQTLVFDPVSLAKVRYMEPSGPTVFCPPSVKGYIVDSMLLVIDAASDSIMYSVALPFDPDTWAYNRVSNKLYFLARSDGQRLCVFDPSGDTVLRLITTEHRVTAMLWDSSANRVYMGTQTHSGVLYVIDCATDTLVTLPVDLMEIWDLALSTVSRKLYCWGRSNATGDSLILVLDADSLRPVAEIHDLHEVQDMVYGPVTNCLYCPVAEPGYELAIIDCSRDSVRSRLETGQELSITVSPVSGKAYVAIEALDGVLVVDTSGTASDTIYAGAGMWGPEQLQSSAVRNEIYCALNLDSVLVIDGSADTVAGRIDYTHLTPYKVVFNPAGSKLYLLCPGADVILVLGPDLSLIKRIPTGVMDKDAVPLLNSALNRLYVADRFWLRVIDCNTDSVLSVHDMYGMKDPIPVFVPGMNRLYVFPKDASVRLIWVYDCLRDTFVRTISLPQETPCAVFDPRSNRIYFGIHAEPSVRVFDPLLDSVVKMLDLGDDSDDGRMLVDEDRGVLYYTEQSSDVLYTVDVLADTLIDSVPTNRNVEALFLNRRLGKLYLCASGTSRPTLVYDCEQGRIIDSVAANYNYTGLMDDRNDKLYLRYGAVVDCRYDSVVTMLPPDSLSPRAMAWNQIDNKVYAGVSDFLYVYRDSMTGVEEQRPGAAGPLLTVLGNPARGVVRVRLQIPSGQQATLSAYDAAGRLMFKSRVPSSKSQVARLDLRSRPAGIYFVRLRVGDETTTEAKVVLQK